MMVYQLLLHISSNCDKIFFLFFIFGYSQVATKVCMVIEKLFHRLKFWDRCNMVLHHTAILQQEIYRLNWLIA